MFCKLWNRLASGSSIMKSRGRLTSWLINASDR